MFPEAFGSPGEDQTAFLVDTRYKKLYLTSVIVKQLTLAISYFPTNMSIKITASKAAVKERSCYHIC